MDPVSQGALGATFAQTLHTREKLLAATWLGCAAGMAPDLDVLIQSSTDPLLFLEYHRHFTHALVFIPIGALVVAGALFRFARHALSFREAYLVCLVGYATHGLLDACTTYGTQLFWPFTNYRVAWNNVSVIDPFFTLPLLAAVVLAYRRRSRRWTAAGIGWVAVYLIFGAVQMHRATDTARELAALRGHTPTELSMKPSFANLLVWKSIYAHAGYYYVDAVRTGATTTVCPGQRVPRLDVQRDLPFLVQSSQQARDLARFNWFSQGYLAPTGRLGEVTDMRYSTVPNQVDPMWGITLSADASPEQHITWWTRREMGAQQRTAFGRLLNGADCLPVADIAPSAQKGFTPAGG